MFLNLVNAPAHITDHLAAVCWMPKQHMGDLHPAGQTIPPEVNPSVGLVFVVSRVPFIGANVVTSESCALPDGPAILRVDEVCFPVGAIAARHTHVGAGIRYLVRGSLRIEAEDHTQTMQAGDCWFESANAPVRAVALHGQGVTSFLRAMVIPAHYVGRSTFQLVDPADANLPRLQMTHRHFDLPLQLDAG